MSEPARKPLLAVMLPTYNEKENIADMVEAQLRGRIAGAGTGGAR